MTYVVYVEAIMDKDVVDWDYDTIENIISTHKLTQDEVIEKALKNTLNFLEEVYGMSENVVKYTKATIIGVVDDNVFKVVDDNVFRD